MLLVGSGKPFLLDSHRVIERFAIPETARVFAEIGVESPEALLATFVTNRAGLERYMDHRRRGPALRAYRPP